MGDISEGSMGTYSADEDSSCWFGMVHWTVRSSLESCTSLYDEFVIARPAGRVRRPTNGDSLDIHFENGNEVSLETLAS